MIFLFSSYNYENTVHTYAKNVNTHGWTVTLTNTIKFFGYIMEKFSILVPTDETAIGLKSCQ